MSDAVNEFDLLIARNREILQGLDLNVVAESEALHQALDAHSAALEAMQKFER